MINTVNPIMTAIRSIFVVTDLSIYWLLGFIYELFFNIATFNIVDREMVFNIFSRVQLVVGVYMMFQLILIIIKGIVNPDSFTDSKTGAGNLIMRIIVSLSLLALLVPINIPSPKNEYEKQINNSGLLFGTLYSLQYRILANNTLGNLILGKDSEYGNPTSTTPTSRPLAKFSDRFVGAIVKTFYQLNTDETTGEYVCDDGFDEEYNKVDTSPFLIIAKGMVGCNNSSWPGKPYVLTMTFLISSIAGIVLCVLMFMMCFEVAKRVFQLAALQLLAPIPIISYMDPKGSKDGAFNSWLKLLGTTYLDLFTRLAVIYFTLFIIDGFIDKFFSKVGELAVTSYSGDFLAGHLLTKWTFIIMCIALFIFAKDAPKFFKQMLGIKGDGKFFSAFGDAMGLGATAIGAVGSFNAGRTASRMADIQNHDEAYANRFGNRAKHIAAGIVGAGKGLAAGSAAASESKGNGIAKTMAAWKAMDQVSDNSMRNGASGSTFLGRTEARAAKIFQGSGNTSFDKETRAIGQKKDIEKSGKDLVTYLKGKGKTDGANYDVTTDGIVVDASGRKEKFTGTVNEFYRAKAQALAAQQAGTGNGVFTFSGKSINANDQGLMEKIEDELCLAAGDEWAFRQEHGQKNAERIVRIKATNPGISESDVKTRVEVEVRNEVQTVNPTWSAAELDAEVQRRTTASNIDSGYAQKRDTYNESIKGADDPNNIKLYNAYSYDEASGKMSYTSTMVNKASKAAGGEAVRRESNAAYKKQQADFGAIKNGK